MTEFLTIKRTQLADAVVVTVKKTDPSLGRPFATFMINGPSRYATRITDFVSEAAALAAHDGLVARVRTSKMEQTND